MQKSPTPWAAGQQVSVRDEAWVVLGVETFETAHLLHLRGLGDGNRGELRTVAAPFDVVAPLGKRSTLRQRSRGAVLSAAACAIGSAAPWQDCWTAATARIDLHAWQLAPARAAVGGATRILLADHVGLGKTIQAALIIAELRARALVERVLVLTPPSLRDQWAAEMTTRFGLQPVVYDHASLDAAAASLPPDANPWRAAPLIVSSIDLVKRPEVRAALDDVLFDMLIVDEAHHITPGTDRGAVVADLAARAAWVVLITATPHAGDDAAYAFLSGLGANGTADLVTFRRSAVLATRQRRKSLLLPIRPTSAEQALLDATARYARAARRDTASAGGTLVAFVIARRAASSAEAAHTTLARRLLLLRRDAVPEAQPLLPWEDDGAADGELCDALLAEPALADAAQEIAWLTRLVALADAARQTPSKIDALRRLLRRTSEPVLVFSEYRDVVEIVAGAIADAGAVAVLHAGMPPRERTRAVASFNAGAVRVLVCTDAAGEGLNLQARCRLVVNMELPWTPRRLEQRIGRVDRIGQTRRVHALQLVHRDSFEGTVIARLERRRTRMQALGLAAMACEETTRAAVERQLRTAAHRFGVVGEGAASYASRRRKRSGAGSAVLLYSAALVDASGRAVGTVAVPLAATFAPTRSPGHLTRAAVRRIAADDRVRTALHDVLVASAAQQSITAAVADSLARRLATCIAQLHQRRTDVPWQGSLFDRRAERHAQRRRESLAHLEAALERRRASMLALSDVSPATPQLVAAWLAD